MKVFIVASLTADGFLAQDVDQFSPDWTSPEDTQLFVELTKKAGVMIMGSRTFDTIVEAGRVLPGRKIVVYSSRPHAYSNLKRKSPTEITTDAPARVIERLKAEGYQEVAICGGAHIYNLFMQSGVVDELYLTVEPKIFGRGVGLFDDSMNVDLELLELKKLNDNTISLHYKVKK